VLLHVLYLSIILLDVFQLLLIDLPIDHLLRKFIDLSVNLFKLYCDCVCGNSIMIKSVFFRFVLESVVVYHEFFILCALNDGCSTSILLLEFLLFKCPSLIRGPPSDYVPFFVK
jgi:hypothetical protein